MEEDNCRFCEEYAKVPVLACVKDRKTDIEIETEAVAALYQEGKVK